MLAKANQPWETAGYSTFTAELASTGNEQLLIAHMLKNAKTREEKLFYLGQQMEGFRGTFFRQAMFGAAGENR
jgi:oligoendopeptidase F